MSKLISIALEATYPAVAATPTENKGPSGQNAPAGQTFAIALRPEVVASERLVTGCLRLAASVLDKDPYSGRRLAQDKVIEDLRSRLYCAEGNRPEIVKVNYLATVRNNDTEPSASQEIRVNVNGKSIGVTVVPMFVLGIDEKSKPFVLAEDEWTGNGAFPALLVMPSAEDVENNTHAWTALHIGLVAKPILEEFNRLMDAKGVPPIPKLYHSLEKIGARYMEWTPTVFEKKHGQVTLGFIGGKRVIQKKGTEFPAFKDDGQGNLVEYLPGVFEYQEYPGKIVVTYRGEVGQVDLSQDEKLRLEKPVDSIDPYAAVGQSPTQADPDKIQERVAHLIRTVSDTNNPTVAYAKGLGLVQESDDLDTVKGQVERILKIAAAKLHEDLQVAWRRVSQTVLGAVTELTLEAALEGADEKVVRARRKGEDALTKYVASKIGRDFDWAIPMDRKLRLYVLSLCERAARQQAEAASASKGGGAGAPTGTPAGGEQKNP